MASVEFLLGNVDKEGQLQEDEDLREILEEGGDGSVLRDYFAGGFDLDDLTKGTSKQGADGPIVPGADARDFSDTDSLAEDEGEEGDGEEVDMNELVEEAQVKDEDEEDRMSIDLFGPEMSSQLPGQPFGAETLIALLGGRDGNEEHGLTWSDEQHDGIFDDLSPEVVGQRLDEDISDVASEKPVEDPQEAKRDPVDVVREWFPTFTKEEILQFTDIFGSKPAELNRPVTKPPRVCVPLRLNVEAEQDERQIFKSHFPVKKARHDIIRVKRRKLVHEVDEPQAISDTTTTAKVTQQEDLGYTDAELAFLADDWEDRVAYDSTPTPEPPISDLMPYTNDEFREADWVATISALTEFDPSSVEPPAVLKPTIVLNMNDKDILLEPTGKPKSPTSPRRRGGMLSKFNFSNDAAYEAMRENLQSRIRASSAPLTIEHSGLAARLQHPFYKTKLSKFDARAFHRPQFTVKIDHEIHLSKMRSRKKKKDRGKDIANILATSKDLSLSDNSTAVLMEFSEEYPPILSNVGMGSKLINFYRKSGIGDDTRPKLDLGEANVLDTVDKSPFGDYGLVEPGETTRALYNKIIKAPIFPHEPNSNDFLLIRNHTRAGGPRYFLRQIRHLFVVGQTFPIIDVPSPHSRRALNAQKARLKMIALRVLKKLRAKGETEGLHVRRISRHFPDQNDMQIRGRLKEFMDFKKSGPSAGHWELKFNEAMPDEEGIRSMISPETVVLLDSMQAGARHLEDAGYSRSTEDDEDESNLSIEQQLAPWIATRNFLDATQGKAMLKLNGEGDPTGVGEGFNFIKVSMKGGFKASGEPTTPAEPVEKGKEGRSYNVAQQQKAYENEITRIWNAQKASLSNTHRETDDDREFVRESTADGLFDVRTPRALDFTAPSPAPSNADTLEHDDDYLSDDSQFSSLNSNRILRITRTFKTPDGGTEKRVETVTDPHVINAYVKKRHQIEAAALTAEEKIPSSQGDLDNLQRKFVIEELARLKRNRDRRIARKRQQSMSGSFSGPIMGPPTPLGETPPSTGSPAPIVPKVPKVATFRKCSACGQVGHVKTNRQCPLYAQTAAAEGWDQK